jgi:hypothetical protein
MQNNPFLPSAEIETEKGVTGDARLVRSSFLFRIIELDSPFPKSQIPIRLRYSGWWFVQRVDVNGIRAWTKISWLDLSRQIQFDLPAEVDSQCRPVNIEINFRPGLMIRRFRIWVDGQLQFDQVA